ncbi:MAG: PAS domain S-box protein [Ignavibacteriae bacterium]|nr:PAS domain S-box protein [Ignavibacteriota bacterium]
MNQAKILVVEDESIVSLEIQSRLEELGYEVAGAVYSGEDAVSTSKEISPDLILMDINLRGDIDGIEAANQIKGALNIPIIYMTAYADEETIQRAKVSEPYAYIIKPIEVRELLTSIEIALFKSQMEKKLIESERRFRGLFENATLGLYRMNLDCEVLMANNALITMLGYESLAELNERNNNKDGYLNPNKRNEFINELEKKGSITAFESEWKRKDGSVIYISESASKNIDEFGNAVYEGTVENITERKLAENNLRDSEEILHKVFDNVYNGIIIHDTEGNILKVNDKILQFHGLNTEQFKNLTVSDLLDDKNTLEKLKAEWKKVINGENRLFEFKANKYNSNLFFDVEVFLTTIKIKEKTHILANIRNVTEEKKAKEALINAKENLQKVYDNVHNAIFIHKEDGSILDVNEKMLSMYNVDRIQALTLNIIDISSNDSSLEKAKFYWQKALEGEDQVFEWKAKRPGDNSVFDVEVFLTKITFGGSNYILANVKDITEQKKVKLALIEAKDAAEKSDRLKSDFLAGMSHEIRTPVNTILSYSSLLKDELKDLGIHDFSDIFHSISFGGKRLIRTVDSILNMSQIQTGTFDIVVEKTNLENDILIPIFSEFKVEAQNKGLKFYLERFADDPTISGDSYSLTQLFNNLIDNALKYTNAGEVKIRTYNNGNHELYVDISDTGIGISDEFLKNIFNPFTQESQGYTRKFDGNGLGLALVKRYCDLNKADISIKSKKGEGSTFTVKFKNSILS